MMHRFGFSIRAQIILGLFVPLCLVLVISVLLFNSNERQLETNRWVDHTHSVISRGHELTKLLVDMESGVRGFLLTGQSTFLEPYDMGSYSWPIKLQELKELVSDNPEQVIRLEAIDVLMQQWQAESSEAAITDRLKLNNLSDDIVKSVSSKKGKKITDKIRAIKSEFIQVEEKLMTERQADEKLAIESTKSIFITGGVAAVLLALIITYLTATRIVRNLRELVEKSDKIATGDFDAIVEVNSKDEFYVLAKSFNSMTSSLKDSTKKLEHAVKVKTDFLANMSHEIRTPMNGILGMLTFLEDTHLSKQQLEYTQNIRSCGDGLLVVINDILDVSKLESGKLTLESKPFDLMVLINESTCVLDGVASNKGLSITLDIDDKLPAFLLGDRMRLKQVLINLLSNAVKFTNKGLVEIILSVESLSEVDCKFTIEIVDQGIGISANDLDKLFKPFSQVDNSATRQYEGTGLGLNICAQLIKQMQGTISVESEEGKGSTFILRLNLPIAKEAPEPIQPMTLTNQEKHETVLADEIPLKILVAEDNKINQLVAKKLFTKLGYKIDVAANGVEATIAVKNNDYDVIFMDMQMPEMDGITATNEILQEPSTSDIKIIAMTANVLAQDKQRCFDAGMVGFIGKPINIMDIIKEIKRL